MSPFLPSAGRLRQARLNGDHPRVEQRAHVDLGHGLALNLVAAVAGFSSQASRQGRVVPQAGIRPFSVRLTPLSGASNLSSARQLGVSSCAHWP